MNESSNQTSHGGASQSEPAQGMGVAAADFRRNVQEASERLSNAGSQLVSMSQELAAAIAEAKVAAQQAQAAQAAAEATQAQMQRDYGAVSDLVRELQDRIGALAILARPLAQPAVAAPPTIEPIRASETTAVDAPAFANAAAENYSPAPSEAEIEMETIADPTSAEAAHPELEETRTELPAQPQPGQFGYQAPNSGYSYGSSSGQSWSTRTW